MYSDICLSINITGHKKEKGKAKGVYTYMKIRQTADSRFQQDCHVVEVEHAHWILAAGARMAERMRVLAKVLKKYCTLASVVCVAECITTGSS